jgi:hypothetical protein
MIKTAFIHSDDIRVSTFVVGMTAITLDFSDIRGFPMKAFFQTDIVPNFIMAIGTQCFLRFFIKRFMAFGTLFLILRMSLNDLARQYQGFGRQNHGWKNRAE